ncbi:hypothetical protein BH24ACT2_BH24ACT2_13810 [soil metagenome]
MFHRVTIALLAVLSSLLTMPWAAAGAAAKADAAVQVTTTPSSARGHAIPVVAVDPRNSDVVAIAEGETRSSRCGLHVSTDAGLTWQEGANPQPENAPRCVRNTEGPIADLTFGPDGTLFYAFPGWPMDDWHSQIFLSRSTDLGRSFETVGLGGEQPDYANGYAGSNALPVVRVDPQRPERVYVAWSSNYGLWNLEDQVPGGAEATRTTFKRRPYLAVSDDGGRTFSPPIDMAGGLEESLTQPSLAIGEDGKLYAFFGETQVTEFGEDVKEGHLFFAVSEDAGKTFTQEMIHTQPAGIEFTYLNTPSAAVNPVTDEVYVAWEETGSETPKVLFMASSDSGETWSSPTKLNSVDPQRTWDFQEFNPWISVAPNGRIDAAWYDWRDDVSFTPGPEAENALQHVYATSSDDGGRTWSPNVRVTDRAIDRRLSDVWQNGVHGPVGLASTDDGAYIAWDDSRNAVGESKAQDIYFTRLDTNGAGLAGVTSNDASTGDNLLWASLGLAVGIGLSGLALIAARMLRSGDRAAGKTAPASP